MTPRRSACGADEYVDSKLGAFEAVLAKTLEAVGRGRQKLHGRVATDDLGVHMAAQDELGRQHSSDADFLSDLAESQIPVPDRMPAQMAPALMDQEPTMTQAATQPGALQSPEIMQQPEIYDPYGYPRPQQPQQPQQQDGYGYAGSVRVSAGPLRVPAAAPAAGLLWVPAAGPLPAGPATAAGSATARPRRDQPLRHQHDRPRPTARIRAGTVKAEGADWVYGGQSSILALRSLYIRDHRCPL